MDIIYTHRAAKEIEVLPRSVQQRIIEKMRFYASHESPLKFAKQLTDYREGEYRFRIGDYRVVFDVDENKIYVLKVGKRDRVYD